MVCLMLLLSIFHVESAAQTVADTSNIESLLLKGQLLRSSKSDSSIYYLHQALAIARAIDHTGYEAQAFITLGVSFCFANYPKDSVRNCFNRAWQLVEQNKLKEERVDWY